jgi:thiamine pyrophosphate-dependent acetolactate synthase large subunit-like protein
VASAGQVASAVDEALSTPGPFLLDVVTAAAR